MPLVTSQALFARAMKDRFAIGAFNANNMEQIQAIVETAQEERAPVILQVSQGAIRYCGLSMAAGMVKIAASLVDVPVVLHLDHGTDFEQNVRCLREGFTSLMFDGSKLSFDDNVAVTSQVTTIAHACGIPVEAELGKVLQAKDNVTAAEVKAAMTDPDEAKKFLELTRADSLAVAVGSVHAMEAQAAELDLQRIAEIRDTTGAPLVLHGSSGVTDASLVGAIENGVVKINVATFLNQGFVAGIKQGVAESPDNVDPRKWLTIGRDMVKERVREKIRLFKSNGRIDSAGGFVSAATQHRSSDLGALE
ncbi:MAG TPA: ketose-bisphosphate aldolase [Propionibacteriaceae bacterium]|nr:ketose-bisphosphate aldolase [Propionibacteriaceae bacterium]